MASIIKDITIEAPADAVWDALRDFGAVHDRLAAGFVTHTRLADPGTRVVTFFTGVEATERLVTSDDERRRLVYTIVDSPMGSTHDNSVAEVFDDGDGGTRFVWTKDVLPDALAPTIADLMEQGLVAVKQTLER